MTKFILAFLAFPFWALEDSGGDGEGFFLTMLVLIAVVSVIMGGQHLVQQLGKHRKEADGDCPKCADGNIRIWDGQQRCWKCGYIVEGKVEPKEE